MKLNVNSKSGVLTLWQEFLHWEDRGSSQQARPDQCSPPLLTAVNTTTSVNNNNPRIMSTTTTARLNPLQVTKWCALCTSCSGDLWQMRFMEAAPVVIV